ncbi:hypothetical protein [uncultured Enterococcus sp.]|uniref:hypothetical protein n=1 Tax=uncultured Enterococcus sp. TaxID=167972 RepID=UPI002AA74C3F|nr:hypothetical protein [uncultured Enterococcus sp.]
MVFFDYYFYGGTRSDLADYSEGVMSIRAELILFVRAEVLLKAILKEVKKLFGISKSLVEIIESPTAKIRLLELVVGLF